MCRLSLRTGQVQWRFKAVEGRGGFARRTDEKQRAERSEKRGSTTHEEAPKNPPENSLRIILKPARAKGKMPHTTETEARNLLLKSLLLHHVEEEVPWRTIFAAMKLVLGETVTEDAGEVNVRMLKKDAWPDPSYLITATKNGLALTRKDRTLVGARTKTHRELKERLGSALWTLFFGEANFGKYPCRLHPSGTLSAKIEQLRRKHAPALWIDAGSTTLLAVHQLLEAKSFPLLVPDVVSEEKMPVRPLLVTNSYEIAAAVGSSRHHLDLRVRLVSGEVKMNLKSVSGLLTERCLEAWHMRGDVAVVGATGIRDDEAPLAFCCDTLEEADVKSSFLRACWFRVVIADSSKIGGKGMTTATQAFGGVSSEALDLVVLDDGVQTKKTVEVQRFLERAKNHGAACLILNTPVAKGGPVEHRKS